MHSQKMAPLKVLSTEEVCERYQMSPAALAASFVLYRKIKERKFPSPTGKRQNRRIWDVRVLEDYDTKMLQIATKSWDPALVTI